MTRIEAIIIYVIGLFISIANFMIAIKEINKPILDISEVAAIGIFNIFIFLVQLLAQVKNKKFQKSLLLETLLLTFIYINMFGFHAYGNWSQYLAVLYIFFAIIILLKNVSKIRKNFSN